MIPTAVDTQRYIPKKEDLGDPEKLVIGWTGTSTNIKYLKQIEPVLESVVKRHKDIILRVICDKRPDFHGALGESLDFIPWSSDIEVESIQGLSIGIMPLLDTDWEKGSLEQIKKKDHSGNLLINDKGICKTSQAKPGLLEIQIAEILNC